MGRETRFRPTTLEALEDRLALSVTVGALGDSYTDEYAFYPPHRSTARNWVEILAATRPVDFGQPGLAGGGFELNWARGGATTRGMARDQLPGLAEQVATGGVDYAWIFIGGNDFAYSLAAAYFAGASASAPVQGALARVESRAEANFSQAVDTLLEADPDVRLVVATVPEFDLSPIVRSAAQDPRARGLLEATDRAIGAYDDHIRAVAAGSDRIALADLAAEWNPLEGAGGSVRIGGTPIDLTTPGDGFRHFFLADGIHAGTVAQGLIADAFLEAIDTEFGAGIPRLDESEIVGLAREVQRGTTTGPR